MWIEVEVKESSVFFNHYLDYVGIALKYFRRLQGLRQLDVAEMAGISARHYQKIETGHAGNINLETLISLSNALGITLYDMIAEIDISSPIAVLSGEELKTFQSLNCNAMDIFQLLSKFSNYSRQERVSQIISSIENRQSFTELGDISGFFIGEKGCFSKETSARYSVDREYMLGDHSIHKSAALKILYKSWKSPGSVAVAMHDFSYNVGKTNAIMVCTTIKDSNSNPLMIYSGIDCTSDTKLMHAFQNHMEQISHSRTL